MDQQTLLQPSPVLLQRQYSLRGSHSQGEQHLLQSAEQMQGSSPLPGRSTLALTTALAVSVPSYYSLTFPVTQGYRSTTNNGLWPC